MKIDLKEQNLIDKHSNRLLSSLRIICNCYTEKKTNPEEIYTKSSLFLYYILFIIYAEELEICTSKELYDFLISIKKNNSTNSSFLSENFLEIIKKQFTKISNTNLNKNLIDLDHFNFSLNDLINLSDYMLYDEKGSQIVFNNLKLEFLNYLYELILKFTIIETNKNLIVSHKGSHEVYKEEKISDHVQLSLNLNTEEEVIYEGQWIIQKNGTKKQSQGSFYTPPKIVDYIINKTLESYKSLKDIKLIDPACGCGSFLLNTFYYLKEKGLKPKAIVEKHLYGIDIEPIPVEISKLILTLASGNFPKNIYCGDTLLTENLPFKPNIFDAVIGNPPYLNIERIDKLKKSYYSKNYFSASRRYDLYILFIEQAIKSLLKANGKLGYIIPDKLLTQAYAKNIRKMILDDCSISEIVDIKYSNLFKGAKVVPIIIIIGKEQIKDNLIEIKQIKSDKEITNSLPQDDFKKTFNFIFRLSLDNNKKEILDYIQSKSQPITNCCYVSWGLQPGNTKKFIFNEAETMKYEMYKNHPNLKNIIRGGNLDTYYLNYTNDKVLYIIEGKDKLHRPAFPELFETTKIVIPEVSGSRGILAALDTNHYYTNHSVINVIMKRDLLKVDKKLLKARSVQLELTKSNHEEILWQIDSGAYTKRTTIYRTDRDSLVDIRYLLALINSKLIRYYFNHHLTGELNVFPELVKRLPYFDLDLNKENHQQINLDEMTIPKKLENLSTAQIHDILVKLVDEIENGQPHKRTEHINLIDKLTYQLYQLDENMISLIEKDFLG